MATKINSNISNLTETKHYDYQTDVYYFANKISVKAIVYGPLMIFSFSGTGFIYGPTSYTSGDYPWFKLTKLPDGYKFLPTGNGNTFVAMNNTHIIGYICPENDNDDDAITTNTGISMYFDTSNERVTNVTVSSGQLCLFVTK